MKRPQVRSTLLAILVLFAAGALHVAAAAEFGLHAPLLRAYGADADVWNRGALAALHLGVAAWLARRALWDRRLHRVRPNTYPWAGLPQKTVALFLMADGLLIAWQLPINLRLEFAQGTAAALAALGGFAVEAFSRRSVACTAAVFSHPASHS